MMSRATLLLRAVLIQALVPVIGGGAVCVKSSEQQPLSQLELVRRSRTGDTAPVTMDFDDTGQAYLLAGMYGPIHVWRAGETGAASSVVLPVSERISTAAFVGGDQIFMASEPGSVVIWRWGDQQQIFHHRFGNRAHRATISRGGHFIAFGGVVLDSRTGGEIGAARPLATQSALEFDGSGTRVVSAGFQEPWIVIRDIPSGVVRQWLAPDKVRSAALSSNGGMIAAAMQDGDIAVWRQPGGEKIATWSGFDDVRGIHFVPGDRKLVVVDDDGIAVYEISAARRTFRGRMEGKVWAFGTEGDIVAAGASTGAVLVWDLAREALVARGQGSPATIAAIAVSPGARLVAAADQNGDVSLWRWK
jgi:WD40 repeat protein